MLHCQVADWFRPEQINQPIGCPTCKQQKPINTGFMFLAHYYGDEEGTIAYGTRWFCSFICFLSFESARFMGRA